MALTLDKKMLSGFSQEVQSYLPEIREGIATFRKNTTRLEALSNVLRHIHTIKGASGMLGFSALSQATSQIETTLEDVVAGRLAVVASQVEWLALTVDHIEQYMDSLLAGKKPDQTIVTEVDQLLQEFTSQPEGSPVTSAAADSVTQPAIDSTAAAEATMLDEEAPTLLIDAALALSLDLFDDASAEPSADTMVADLAVTAPEPLATADAAAAPAVETLSWPAETMAGMPASESTAADDFSADLLLDSTDAVFATAEMTAMLPAAVPPAPVPADDMALASAPVEITPEDAAVVPELPEEAAFTLDAVTTPAVGLESPEDTAVALAPTADEATDDFAADLLVAPADLEMPTTALAPQDDQTAMAAATTPASTVELPAATVDTAAPLPSTPGALDTLIASIDSEIQRVYTTDTLSTVRQRMLDGDSTAERYLLFTLHERLYAVAVTHVLEVGRLPAVTPVPNVPAWLRGVVNLRGEILSVIDVRTFLGYEDGHYTEQSRMLVVKTQGEDMTTSLVVDQVKGFAQLPKASVQLPAMPLEDKVAPYLTGVCEYAEQTLAVFDLERFLLSPEVRQFD